MLAPVLAGAASFDCAKARTPMEKMICSTPELSLLDEALNDTYSALIHNHPAKPALVQWQRDWLRDKARSCGTPQCLIDAYHERLALLKDVATDGNESVRWTGVYERYRNGRKDSNTASLTLIGLKGDRVQIEGSAIWLGPNAQQGQVHVGQINLIGQASDATLPFYEYDDAPGCNGTIVLRSVGVKVEQESGCGGHNVTFNGDYRRVK